MTNPKRSKGTVKVHMLGFEKVDAPAKTSQKEEGEGEGMWDAAKVVEPDIEFETLTNLYSENATLQRCIDLTANAVVKNGFQIVPDEKNAAVPEEVRNFFDQGNPSKPFTEEMRSVVIDLLNTGCASLEIARLLNAASAKPSAFYRMAVKNVRVAKGQKGEFKTGQRYVEIDAGRGFEKKVWYNAYTPLAESRTSKAKENGYMTAPPEGQDVVNEAMWFMLPNPNSKWYGQSPAESLSRILLIATNAEDFNVDQFAHGWLQKFLFVLKGGALASDQLEELKTYMDEILHKEKEWNRVPIIELNGEKEADFRVEQLNGGSTQDGAYLELMKYVREMTFMGYGVPPILLNIVEDANRANSVSQRETFYEDQVRPIQMLLSYRLTKLVREDFGFKGTFVWNKPDLTNVQEDALVVESMVRMGVLTLNEGRELLGKEKTDEPLADEHLIYTSVGVFPLSAFGDPENMQAQVGDEAAKLLINVLQQAKTKLLDVERKERIAKGTDDGGEPIYPDGILRSAKEKRGK